MTPRPADSYRGAKRNLWRRLRVTTQPGMQWPGARARYIPHPPVRENRSKHHEKPKPS